jgi:hypothetical protein
MLHSLTTGEPPVPPCGVAALNQNYKLASLGDEDDQGIALARIIQKNKVKR